MGDYTFAEVNNTKGLGPAYAVGKFDGICGMGLSGISVDGVPTPLQALKASGALDEDIFAFYLGHQSAGELVIGGVDPSHYTGEFSYLPVINMVPGRMAIGRSRWTASRSTVNLSSTQTRLSWILAPLCWLCLLHPSKPSQSSLVPKLFCQSLRSTRNTRLTATARVLTWTSIWVARHTRSQNRTTSSMMRVSASSAQLALTSL